MAKLIKELKSGSLLVLIADDTKRILISRSSSARDVSCGFGRYQTAQELLKDEPGYINDDKGESLSIGDGWRIDINEDGVEQNWCRGW